MKPRSLMVVTMESPYPPSHGGRIDSFNRWTALSREGWKLQLVTWLLPNELGEEDKIRAGLSKMFGEVHLLPHARGAAGLVQRLVRLPRLPPHLGARDIPPEMFERIVEGARRANVGAVIADGLFGSHLARAAARRLSKPMIYRAHNHEGHYIASQARATKPWGRRLGLQLATIGLESYERGVHADAVWTLDVSAVDIDYWRSLGFDRTSWCPPPLPRHPAEPPAQSVEISHDLVYLASLWAPNNLEGMRWFMARVLPRLAASKPDIKILFAGANPPADLVAEIARHREIELLPNPASAAATRARGRVLINPVLTGSGTNVKSMEMLITEQPIVTNLVAVQGFPKDLLKTFAIARDAEDFATLCLAALANPVIDLEARHAARDAFGERALRDFSDRIAAIVDEHAEAIDLERQSQ